MKKRKGSLLQRMLAVLLSAVLVTGMASNAAPVSVLAQEGIGAESVSGNDVEPAEETNPQEQEDGTEQDTPGTVTEEGTGPETVSGNDAAPEIMAAPQRVMMAAVPMSGTCGDNVTWTLENKVLTISGVGEMKNYNAGSGIPWFDNGTYTDIESVVIENGVTGIGKNAFFGCSSLTSVTIADSVKSIGDGAFWNSTKLEKVTIPQSVTSIGDTAFFACSSLQDVTVCSKTPPICGSAVFSSCATGLQIHVPVCDYLTAEGWETYEYKIDAAAHTGDISYLASGSVITQKCGKCNTEYGKAKLSLSGTNFTYIGAAITPASVTYADSGTNTWSGEKPTAITYENNTNVGTATASLTLGTGETAATATLSFMIQPKALTDIMVTLSADSFPHTGNAVTPEVTVQDGGTILTKDTDYTVSYTNNSDVGTAAVTVTGKGNYSGAITKNFQIVESDADKVAAAKTVVENALAGITATNATTDTEILGVIDTALNNAGITGVTVTIDKFIKREASTSAEGSIEGVVFIDCGQESGSVNMEKTIAQLMAVKYTVTVNSGIGSGEYEAGATVTITADAPASGKQFDEWEVNSGSVTLTDSTSSTTTFTMPAGAVEVTATYRMSDESRVANAKEVVENALAKINATNDTEREEVQAAIDNALSEAGITDVNATIITWNSVDNKATTSREGKITVRVNVHHRTSTEVYQMVETELIIPKLPDTQPPTGKIEIEDNSWTRFLNVITFRLFFRETKQVTITAQDEGSGVEQIYYYISDEELMEAQVKALGADSWTEGNSFSIAPDRKCVIYAKITDNAGNVTYLSSDGLVFDGTPPVINGVTDGETYNEPQTVTVTDAMSDVESVTVNGTEIALTDKQFTLGTADDSQTIVATDKAGNTTTVTVTVKVQSHNHSLTLTSAKSATCTEDGNTAYYTCDGCEQWFWDADGTQEITNKDSVVISKTGHSYDNSEWGYKEADGHAHNCQNCDAHDTVQPHTPGAAATAETPQTCTVCGYIIAPATGTVIPEVKPGVNTPATNISTLTEELKQMLLTDEEKQQVQNGTNIRIVLEVQDAGNTVSDSDQAAVAQALNGFAVGQYLNIDLYKLAGADRTDITETAKKIRIVITVPDSLKNTGSNKTRTFAVIRLHDGRAELLADLDDSADTITIETDRFSTYAVVYKDTENGGSGNNGNDSSSSNNSSQNNSDKNDTTPNSAKDNEPETGDSTPLELYATLAMIAGFTYLLLYFADRKRGMTEETKRELVSRLIGWAKRGGRIRKCLALAAVFVLLVYYHSIGKKTCAEWKEIYGE